MYLFSSRGLKVSFRFKEMQLHCLWTFLQTGYNVNKHVEEHLCQGDAHTWVWFYQGFTPKQTAHMYIFNNDTYWNSTQQPEDAEGSLMLRAVSTAAGILHCKHLARLSKWQLHLAGATEHFTSCSVALQRGIFIMIWTCNHGKLVSIPLHKPLCRH